MKGRVRLLCGAGLLGLVALAAAFAGVIAPEGPWALTGIPLSPPSLEAPLGTDSLGRDVLAGIAYGARATLVVGVAASLFALLSGTMVGACAGVLGGVAERVLMQAAELFQLLPAFLLAVTLVAVFHPSLPVLAGAIAVVSWAPVARLVRAEILSLRARPFVQASVAIGRTPLGIMLRHILPNVVPVLAGYASVLVANAILLEAGVSFLGLGDPNVMSWGYMVGASRSIARIAWWTAVFPGLAILLTVLGVHLLAGGLRGARDRP
ncbi:MAG: hypothetical protein B7Y12_00640 [Rhizobiales bacterium 24-66-13]|jgi:peptide/nickel transport system permease protein|nr:MAG: hypothetical protein B7Y95_04200 [Rhizobiales bacterium 32-66-11]OYY14020.1 MAG: hypothetical protein B7Y70_00125 [Rhizobiales bacterium 35-68-8]OYZ83110.1 MAG: hypothetical protein B7Y12_00640 [Rhizobiales bacterium 24-66-13]OZB12040.1 MAG: hypothetical protein B7X67_01225 [Rhizobiales bacterium 39-66-18]HQS45625.1 ABC transporter permease [Xanthobacteraceae bacterium]